MRVVVVGGNTNLLHLHNDHPSTALRTGLGSNSVMSYNSGGGAVGGSQVRYYPYGDWRTTPSQTISDRAYTGQLENMELGLYYYNARYYVVGIGRFASADTIVPDPTDPQSFNRYSYVGNRPIVFSDPTGHNPLCNQAMTVCSDGAHDDGTIWAPAPAAPPQLVAFDGSFTPSEKAVIESATSKVARAYAGSLNAYNRLLQKFGEVTDFLAFDPHELFLLVHGGPILFKITHDDADLNWPGWRSNTNLIQVNIAKRTGIDSMWVFHELGHDFNGSLGSVPYTTLAAEGIFVGDVQIAGTVTGNNGSHYRRTFDGFQSGTFPYIQNRNDFTVNEDFADTFSNWVAQSFAPGGAGAARNSWMNSHMPMWLSLATAQQ